MKKILLVLSIIFIFSFKVVYADTSRSSVVIDMDSGRILYENNKDERRLIASITKIMTAVIAIENSNLEKQVTVGDEVLKMYGSNIYLEVGEEISLRDLLYGLMLRSGNDAAVVIAKNVGGSEEAFVNLMNKKAKELGMSNTTFSNSHGLDDETENYSSAYDMAKLMRYANTLMDFVDISGTKKWTVTTNKKSYIWFNRNKLLKEYKYLTGGKTGYTPRAGKTLVTTASKNNLNLIAVTLKDDNHYETQKELYEYLFNKYEKITIIDKNNIKFDNRDYYVDYSFSYPVTKEEKDLISIHADIYNNDNYVNNQKVGELYVLLNNQEIYRENIYIKKKIKENKSFFVEIKEFFNSHF